MYQKILKFLPAVLFTGLSTMLSITNACQIHYTVNTRMKILKNVALFTWMIKQSGFKIDWFPKQFFLWAFLLGIALDWVICNFLSTIFFLFLRIFIWNEWLAFREIIVFVIYGCKILI